MNYKRKLNQNLHHILRIFVKIMNYVCQNPVARRKYSDLHGLRGQKLHVEPKHTEVIEYFK